MVALVAVGTDKSVLTILHAVFILDHAAALLEDPPLLALAALSALILEAVGIPEDAYARVDQYEIQIALGAAVLVIGQAVVDDANRVVELERREAGEAALIGVLLAAREVASIV